jgi:hypothetical protein
MPADERAAAGMVPTIPPPETDALPWMRLITGVVALAIVAMPAGRHVAEWTARPIPDRIITVAALPPLEPALAPSNCPEDAPLASAPQAARPGPSTALARSVFGAAPAKQLRAQAPPHRAPRLAANRHGSDGYTRVAAARHGLTRAQVVRDYIASREQVAALTREDSGSAYLMRVAARAREPKFMTDGARRQHRPNRAAAHHWRTTDEPRRRSLRT